MGVLGGEEALVGMLPRAVRQIFNAICEDTSGAEFAVSCSYLEIYKEVIRDLLQPDTKGGGAGGLAIREDNKARGKGVYVEGLTDVFVMSEADVLECMEVGNANRMVGATLMNAQSSRSHALLTITVQQKLADGSTKVSKLNIADLAGSEKVSKTGSSGETLEEVSSAKRPNPPHCVLARSRPGPPSLPARGPRAGVNDSSPTRRPDRPRRSTLRSPASASSSLHSRRTSRTSRTATRSSPGSCRSRWAGTRRR